ncbi:MAG TPA: outer membrane beta-barrel protein [Gemmatimonadales bacterium]
MRRIIAVAAVGLFAASPVLAQNPQKGTWEFGAFGRFNWYDQSFSQDLDRRENSWGFGLRAARFFSPKWSLELDGSVNPTDLDTPIATSIGTVYIPFHLGVNYNHPLGERLSWILGPRVSYNIYRQDEVPGVPEKEFQGSDWGIGGITGLRYKINETWSVRLDGTLDWMPSPEVAEDDEDSNTMLGVQLGLSLFTGGRCRDKLDSIRVEPKTQNITMGDRAGLRVSGFECDGDVIDATGTSTARITSGQGTLAGMSFTATQAGCVDIQVTNTNARRRGTDNARICVEAPPAPPPVTLDRCELEPASTTAPPGESLTFKVTGFYSDGTSRDLPTATINADGGTVSGRTYTAPLAPGTYTIVAQCGDGRAARATVTVRALTVTLRALFGFNMTNVANQAEIDSLRLLSEELKRFPNLLLTIHGHTDWVGGVASNERLGMRRIQAVLDTLASYGIDKARMDGWTKISFGECQPMADNRTRDGRAQNRRVAIFDTRSAPIISGSGQCRERP